MTINFYGAASEVTGSNFLIETPEVKLLVDCGLFQGRRRAQASLPRLAEEQNYHPFPYNPEAIEAVILTHAHLDHCGRIPKLWKDGFRGHIYATPATRDLAALIMADAADIMLHEAAEDGHQPLYLAADVAAVMSRFLPLGYHQSKPIAPGVLLTLYDAGHILGSATAALTVSGKQLVFSGDIGNQPVPIVRPPETPKEADVLVMEATYGSRQHEDPKVRRGKLRQLIQETVRTQGVLLIPAFALERTQELLYELNRLIEEDAIPPLPVFLDSPLAIEATAVYDRYSEYYNDDARYLQMNDSQLFSFPTLKLTKTVDQSKAIWDFKGPKIIIAGSGMMEGGRILHHAKRYFSTATTTLLIVGYQARGTLGRELLEGRKRVKIMGEWVSLKAQVVALGAYSAHADQPGLKRWLGQYEQPPKRIFLVHSEPEEATAFAHIIGSNHNVTIPKLNQRVEV